VVMKTGRKQENHAINAGFCRLVVLNLEEAPPCTA